MPACGFEDLPPMSRLLHLEVVELATAVVPVELGVLHILKHLTLWGIDFSALVHQPGGQPLFEQVRFVYCF